jgi:hypothetical protein
VERAAQSPYAKQEHHSEKPIRIVSRVELSIITTPVRLDVVSRSVAPLAEDRRQLRNARALRRVPAPAIGRDTAACADIRGIRW